MRKYLSFFRIRFLAGLQYRAAAWAGIATQFAWGMMNILMFRAFYESGQNDFPMEFQQLTSYIWMQQALLAMYMTWFFDNEIFEHIINGTIAYELCRPCDLYAMWFVKNMAIRLSKAVLRCMPILLVAAILPAPYGLHLPASLSNAFLFPISLILGFLVTIAFSMLIYISTFYTLSPTGVRILVVSVTDFLAGGIIPIPFFPNWLRSLMYALPFASMQNTPFLIYVGYHSVNNALLTVLVQLFWLAALLMIGKVLMNRAVKKVVVQGG